MATIVGASYITNASRGTVNAWRFQSHCAAVVMVVVFEFSVMRCQPLRRALAS
ncbi:acetyltransferase [Vibrio cholerae]|nr:acetyltransferase [Vibrio cholerae]EGR2283678.1 acetyltransferase [Vibrio cholerae]TQQ58971.1 acetyltransferase [Vibrio cholerae]